MCVSMPGIVYTNYRQSLVITGGRLLRWKNCELIDTMPDNSVVFVSATDIRTVKHRGVDTVYNRLRSLGATHEQEARDTGGDTAKLG